MKKIVLFSILTVFLISPAQAFTRNPYGIYYAHVYNNGNYDVKIIDVSHKSVADKAGITKDSVIKSISNTKLNLQNTRAYFDSSLLSIIIFDNKNNEISYNLKAKNLNIVDDNIKYQNKYNKYIKNKKYKKAIALLNKYILTYPNDIEAKALLVKALLLNGNYGEAITNLNSIYNITKSPAILGTMSSVYLSLNDIENAKKYAKQTLELDKNEVVANSTMYICSIEDSKYNDALKYANKLVEKNSKSYISYFYRGFAKMQLKSYISAYEDLEKAYNMSKQTKEFDVTPIVIAMVDDVELIVKNSVTNVKNFVEIPSWFDICPGEYLYSNGSNTKWNLYWEKRRIVYFKNIIHCISTYSGPELYKSYASIIKKELRQNKDYEIVREHTWNQERREEIYKYTKDIIKTTLIGAYAIKSTPTHNYVHYSGNINQNVNFSGFINSYNHHYFH